MTFSVSEWSVSVQGVVQKKREDYYHGYSNTFWQDQWSHHGPLDWSCAGLEWSVGQFEIGILGVVEHSCCMVNYYGMNHRDKRKIKNAVISHRRRWVLVDVLEIYCTLRKPVVNITNDDIIHGFHLKVLIQLRSIVKVWSVNSSFLCQKRKRISALIVEFIRVRFFGGNFAVSQMLCKTSTAFAIICKITTITLNAKQTSGHGFGRGWSWELWHGDVLAASA